MSVEGEESPPHDGAYVSYESLEDDRFRCAVHTTEGQLKLTGCLDGPESLQQEGQLDFTENTALVSLLLSYGSDRKRLHQAGDLSVIKDLQKQIRTLERKVLALAKMVSLLSNRRLREHWCSACFERSDHRRVDNKALIPSAYICMSCGNPSSKCPAPKCTNMAIRKTRAVVANPYCAEHRQDIASFDEANMVLADLADYANLFDYKKRNLARAAKITAASAGTGVLLLAPLAVAAAPAIGGALGASFLGGGLTGAAATSHGLAMLGGGSLAAGGLGMAGGVVVVTAAGTALGSATGAAVANAYLKDDKSFKIHKHREGSGGPSVVFSSGWLTEGQEGWDAWQRIIDERYPNSTVYQVYWGSKEMKVLADLGLKGGLSAATKKLLKVSAARASKAATTKLGPMGLPLIAASLAKNPWHAAVARADMTAAVLADLIARTPENDYVLMGHSLGGRVMCGVAQTLGTRDKKSPVQSLHLLGAAVSRNQSWLTLQRGTTCGVWNYHSTNDAVLKNLYKPAQGGRAAVGCVGFGTGHDSIHDFDVSMRVKSHADYLREVDLVGPSGDLL